jgi:hypothetical protein
MRTKFAPFDDALIERLFQPATDLVSHWLGLGRIWTTCVCIDLASLSWIVSRAGGMSRSVTEGNVGGAALDVSLLLLGLVALLSLRTLFRRAGGKQGNPLRLTMLPYRAVALLMLVARSFELQAPGLAEFADVGSLVFAVAALYLGACGEPPPVRRSWAAVVPAA